MTDAPRWSLEDPSPDDERDNPVADHEGAVAPDPPDLPDPE